MKRAYVLLLATCAMGCDAISEKANEFTTVSVGANALSAVQIDRSLQLGPEFLPFCLNVQLVVPNTTTEVAMEDTANGCALSVRQPDLVLFNEEEIKNARTAAGPFDVDGVQSGSVELQSLQLSTADGMPLDIKQFVEAVLLQVDGDTLLERTSTSELLSDKELTREVPDALIDKLKASVKNNQVATADVKFTMFLSAPFLTNLPGSLKVVAVLQPQLEVNVIDAL